MGNKSGIPALALVTSLFVTSCSSTVNHSGSSTSAQKTKETNNNTTAIPEKDQPYTTGKAGDKNELTVPTAESGSKAPAGSDALWESFKNKFAPLETPVTINRHTNLSVNLGHKITTRYAKYVPEVRTERYSRDVGNDYYFFASLSDNANYTAVIYVARVPYFTGRNNMQYLLATFNPHGKIIATEEIAGQLYPSETETTCVIKPDMQFEIRTFKDIYKKDPDQEGYDDNPVVKTELQHTEHYRIAANGKFQKTAAGVAMK